MRTIAFTLLAALLVFATATEAQPPVKSKTDPKAKAGKTENADASKYNMKLTVADVDLGEYVMGPKMKASDLKGQVVLVDYWGITCAPCLQMMPSTAALNAELADFGLIVLGSHRQEGTPQEVRTVAMSVGANFQISIQTFVKGSEDSRFIPHCLLFDHTGACIFRGSPEEAEPLIRTAVGKAIVDGAGREKLSPAVAAIAQELKKGKAPATVLPRLLTLQSSVGEVGADAKALIGSITAVGRKRLKQAEELAEGVPVDAFLLIEKTPMTFKGTEVAQKAAALIAKLKKDKTVAAEMAARPTLEAIRKIEKQLNANLEDGLSPKKDEFQKANAGLLKQMKDRVAVMNKSWPDARATEEACIIGERFGIKQ